MPVSHAFSYSHCCRVSSACETLLYRVVQLHLFLYFLLFSFGTCDFLVWRVLTFSSFLAAIIRKVYLRPGTGVGALQKRFGGNYRYQVKRNIFPIDSLASAFPGFEDMLLNMQWCWWKVSCRSIFRLALRHL